LIPASAGRPQRRAFCAGAAPKSPAGSRWRAHFREQTPKAPCCFRAARNEARPLV